MALDLIKAQGSQVPFILLSGEIGEETAVEAMRNGASDYLLKNNLARLVPALLHAVDASVTRRERIQADLALGASKQRLHELAQHLQTSIEMERAAIAREIHDDVGGSLTAVKFDLAWIIRHSESAEVKARAASGLETVISAIEASQRIMHNLRPAILEQGLVAALQWMAGRFERRTGIPCLLRTPAVLPPLPTGVPLVAYRTAQEALTNVSKHAQASKVEIDLSLAGGVLVAGDQRQRPRPEPGGPGQGTLLRHPRPARAGAHGGRLGGPQQRPGRYHLDPVDTDGRGRSATRSGA